MIRLSTGKTCIRKTDTVNRKGLEAPYMTSYQVAKTGKPPTAVNSFCFRNYDWDNAGKKAKKPIQTMPSSNTVPPPIRDTHYFAFKPVNSMLFSWMSQQT